MAVYQYAVSAVITLYIISISFIIAIITIINGVKYSMTHNALDRFCEITFNILLSWVNALVFGK